MSPQGPGLDHHVRHRRRSPSGAGALPPPADFPDTVAAQEMISWSGWKWRGPLGLHTVGQWLHKGNPGRALWKERLSSLRTSFSPGFSRAFRKQPARASGQEVRFPPEGEEILSFSVFTPAAGWLCEGIQDHIYLPFIRCSLVTTFSRAARALPLSTKFPGQLHPAGKGIRLPGLHRTGRPLAFRSTAFRGSVPWSFPDRISRVIRAFSSGCARTEGFFLPGDQAEIFRARMTEDR